MSWWRIRRGPQAASAPAMTTEAPAVSAIPLGSNGHYKRTSFREADDGRLLHEVAEERVIAGPAGLDTAHPRDRRGFARVVIWVWIIALFSGPHLAWPAQAQDAQDNPSLWSEREGFRFTNRKAMVTGDLITVIVTEASSGRNRSSLSTSKEHKLEAAGGPGAGPLDFIPLFSLDSQTKDELSGDGSVSLSGELRTTITVEVREIRPNGQLVIEGSRMITLNKEEDRITLHGVARPEDIRSDNTILSTKLAEVRITYDGKGAIKRATRPGLFQRLFGWIF